MIDYSQWTNTKGVNAFDADPNLQQLMERLLGPETYGWAKGHLAGLGECCGTELDGWADRAHEHPPEHIPYNKMGERIDEIRLHPAYQNIKTTAYESGIVGLDANPGLLKAGKRGGPVLRFGLGYLFGGYEASFFCPVCLTDGTARVLDKFGSEELKAKYLPRLRSMDRETLLQGAMFLTEKVGGSDVGASECRAVNKGDHWELSGVKYFCSNADADIALVLARPEGAPNGTRGLGLFLVPRHKEDGTLNNMVLLRLKDKMGTRSMATGEYEYQGAKGYAIGDVSKGFAYMTEMLNLSRLYNSVASVAVMRRAFLEAAVYTRNRMAFGQPVYYFPLVQAQLADMVMELEAATALVFEVARNMDLYDAGKEEASRLFRVLTPITKMTTGKLAVHYVSEALELHGGNGYMNDFVMPRLYRDVQVLPIWEGTSNILSLDLLRVMAKEKLHETLLSVFEKRLNALHDPHVKILAQQVLGFGDRVKLQVQSLGQYEREEVEYFSPQLAWNLVRFAEASLLLEEAYWGLKEKQDGRKILVARQFLAKHILQYDTSAIVRRESRILKDAKALIEYQKVPVGEL